MNTDAAEFRHFKYLLAAAEHKGFRAAAEYLNTSRPGLSKSAREFQEALQIQLFQKTKSGRIRLTPTGIAFIAIARDLLEAKDDAINALIAKHQPSAGKRNSSYEWVRKRGRAFKSRID